MLHLRPQSQTILPKFNFYEAELPWGPVQHDITFKRNTGNSQKELKSNLDVYYSLWESPTGVYIPGIEANILNFSVHLTHYGVAVCHSVSFSPNTPKLSLKPGPCFSLPPASLLECILFLFCRKKLLVLVIVPLILSLFPWSAQLSMTEGPS